MYNIADYYSSLYAKLPGSWVVINSFDDKGVQMPSKVEDVATNIARLSANRCNLFHTFAVFGEPPKSGRGKAADITASPAIYLDIDLADTGKYAGTKNPAVALEEIKATLEGWGLPTPSAVVATGNGYHFEYRFAEPLRYADDAARQDGMAVFKGFGAFAQEKAREKGWKLDSVMDLPRPKRALGSQNFKDPSNPKTVELVEFDPDRTYDVQLIASFKPSRTNQASAPPASTKARSADQRLPRWETIAAYCPFVRHCVENAATLGYGQWMAALGIAARCEDGREKAHELSRPYLTYSASETDAKIDETLKVSGPVTYRYIAEAFGFDVSNDLLASRMNSPISFGFADPALIEVLKTTVFDLRSERFYDLHSLQPFSRNSFDMRHGSTVSAPYASFKGSSLAIKAEFVDYLPGQPMLVGNAQHPVLNVYRPPAMKRVAGPCDTILAHFERLIPSQIERDHVLNYLAFMVQQPGTKLTTALLLIGGQGNGKSTIIRWMEPILGGANVKTLTAEAVTSRFQADRTNLQLMVLNEVMGVDRAGANGLKSWVTEETMEVEEKGTPRFRARTPRGVILISNHVDGLNLEETDRRYAVIETVAARPDDAYFERLNLAAEAELPAFAHYLSSRNLFAFNPRAPAPETELKALMRNVTQSPLESAIQSAYDAEDGCFRRSFATAEEIIHTLMSRGFPYRRPAPGSVGTVLKQMGFIALPQQRVPGYGKPRFWVFRETEKWQSADPSEVASHYVRSLSPANDNVGSSIAA